MTMTAELTTRTTTPVDHETHLDELVDGARAGCATSWREIVSRFDARLHRMARALGLDGPSAADVVQQTWLAAVANINILRDADALGGWLHSILYREFLKALRLRRREFPRTEETDLSEGTRSGQPVMIRTEPRSPEDEALRSEQRMLVQAARRQLSRRDQDLLTLLVAEPRLSYAEISRRLGVPTGSIGPTRARCFARMRRELAALGVNGDNHAGHGC